METPEFFFKGGAAAAAGGGGGGGYQYNNSPFNNSEKSRFNGDHFIVDELLDYPNDDGMVVGGDEIITDDGTFDTAAAAAAAAAGISTDSSSITGGVVDNSTFLSGNTTELRSSSLYSVQGDNSCRSFTDGQFSTELCIPYDDMAELEWLSNCVEESFSIEDMQKLQLISGMKAQTIDAPQYHQVKPEPNQDSSTTSTTIFRPEIAVPAKARSKRSRAYPCNWTTRLLAASSGAPPPTKVTPTTMSSSSESDVIDRAKMNQKKKEVMYENDSEGRKCFHCATDKTPQWRTGPMGPKTLCNACGVRYKSGRLVPEYRPAASPTFVLTKHSNSHRKVVELRRQNEFIRNQQHQHQHQQLLHQNMMFDASNGGDFLIHHHLGTDFRQLI